MISRILLIVIALSPLMGLFCWKLWYREPLFQANQSLIWALGIGLLLLTFGLVFLRITDPIQAGAQYTPAEIGKDGTFQSGTFR